MKTERPATTRSIQPGQVRRHHCGRRPIWHRAACRLRQRLPELDFLILESRDAIGGTWDLFRYPGVRSDSDIYSFSYSFRPWTKPGVFASGKRSAPT